MLTLPLHQRVNLVLSIESTTQQLKHLVDADAAKHKQNYVLKTNLHT